MNTLNDYADKRAAIAPIKSDQPLSRLFPLGIPIIFPDGDKADPTLMMDGEEYYEIPLDDMGDTSLIKIAEFYSSDRVPPLLSGYFAIRRQALVPASWIGVAA